MNSIQELIDNGIDKYTAQSMIDSYMTKINTRNGIYIIKDMEYDFNIRGRIVTLECTGCGKVIHRTMIKGRNKWSELIKTCECEKERREQERLEKIAKMKKERQEAAELERLKREQEKANKPHRRIFDRSYIGQTFNYLTVIDVIQGKHKPTAFICMCEACGKIKRYDNPTNIVSLSIKSCGCMRNTLSSQNSTTHGLSKTRLYGIWRGMKYRCYNENCENYADYGGRGISICEEWLSEENGLQNFIEWANTHGYSDELTIDRIDVNGNYEPGNCRWADWFVQANNRRPQSEWKEREKMFVLDGERYTMNELCIMYDTSEPAIRYRMKVMGMTLEQALKTPKQTNGRPRKCAI